MIIIPFKKACLLPYTVSGLKHTMRSLTARHFDGARNSLSTECWKSLRALVVEAEPRVGSSAASPSFSCPSSSLASSSSSSLSSFSSFFDFLFCTQTLKQDLVIQFKYSCQFCFSWWVSKRNLRFRPSLGIRCAVRMDHHCYAVSSSCSEQSCHQGNQKVLLHQGQDPGRGKVDP